MNTILTICGPNVSYSNLEGHKNMKELRSKYIAKSKKIGFGNYLLNLVSSISFLTKICFYKLFTVYETERKFYKYFRYISERTSETFL